MLKVSEYNEETTETSSFEGKGKKILPDSNGLHLASEAADKNRLGDSVIITPADEKIARIISMYLRAKDDYFSLDDSSLTEKLRAAKFLRDRHGRKQPESFARTRLHGSQPSSRTRGDIRTF
jgi:hypothetical protein